MSNPFKQVPSNVPGRLRAANRIGSLVQAVRPKRGILEVNTLLLAARRTAALDDFGPGHFREGLDTLLASLNTEASLSPVGLGILRSQIVGHLATRLRIRDWQKKHDLLEFEEVRAPIIVCGMPRTGTTLLSHLLDLDPFNRSVKQWEAGAIAPPPTLAGQAVDERLIAAHQRHSGFAKMAPHLQAMHETDPHLPTECVSLFGASFQSLMFETLAHIPSYGQWLQDSDMTPTYQHHKLQLQILQSAIPTERWSLKSPAHLWHLDALRSVYPDARMVWTHRDPVKVVGSLASLVTTMHTVGAEHVDNKQVGQDWRDKCLHGVSAGRQQRAAWEQSQWFDLQYAEFVSDPISGVERLYQHFGLELSELARRRMEMWIAEHPKHRLGPHAYALEDFGMTADEVREQFADYQSHFAVPAEG